jgi:SpoVK/Ycf46/Vps4 family AAA+-type ATPase
MEVPFPDKDGLLEILKVHTMHKPLARDVDFNKLIDQMRGFTGADLASIAREAAMLAIKEYIEKKGNMNKVSFRIRMKHFEEAVGGYKKMRGAREQGQVP